MADLAYPVALGLTIAVEVPVYLVALPPAVGISARRAAWLGVLVNVVSHPLLWFVLFPGIESATGSNLAALLGSEAVVWVGEAVALRLVIGRRFGRLFAVSCCANALSLAVGLVL